MSTETDSGPLSIGLTLALASIGIVSLELSVCVMTHPVPVALARAAGWVAVMLATFASLSGRRSGRGGSPTRGETVALLILGGVPFVWHPLRVVVLGGGVMPETVLLEGLRNVVLGLGALSRRRPAARLAAVSSLFGVLVGASLVEGPLMTATAAAFAVLGAAWLLAGYWSSLPAREAASGRTPLTGTVAALAVAVVIPAVSLIGPSSVASALLGLVPTSGGHDGSDPEARSGVGDGPHEVDARDSADSVGFSQSDVYLETDKPSLYDAFNDTFGEPIKPKQHEKAIALDPSEIRNSREHPAEDHKAGREFATHRKPPNPRRPAGERADALVYVQGRAPAHLRLTAYDTFDGHSWIEGQPPPLGTSLRVERPGSPWLVVESPDQPYLSGRVRHRVKLGRLDSAAIPSPAHLERLRVGSVNRVEFFEWSQPEVLRMSGRTIPPGTVIDTEVRTPLPESLRRLRFPDRPDYAYMRFWNPPDGPAVLDELAALWSSGVPRGWSQVEAVVAHLRAHCEHDRSAVIPEDCGDVVESFLVDSRRGPDFLFATTAALALRSLGYPTRVVGGFYVDQRRYDPVARHIAVTTADAHLWVEVQVPGGGWVTVEPTPGYELMPPAYTPIDRLLAALASAGRWANRNAERLALALVGLGLLAWRRRAALDRFWTLAWCLTARAAPPSRAVLATLRLIERRAAWTGRSRPIGVTPSSWCGSLVGAAPESLANDLRTLVRLAQWSAFAPGPLPAGMDHGALCRRVVRGWTLRAFTSTIPSVPGHREPER